MKNRSITLFAASVLILVSMLSACQPSSGQLPTGDIQAVGGEVNLYQRYDADHPAIPWYTPEQLRALQLGGDASYQFDTLGEDLEAMLNTYTDTVIVGQIESKQLIDNGVPCTLVGVTVQQVLKGDPLPGETVYTIGTGAPISLEQLQALQDAGEFGNSSDYDPLPYTPIGAKVLLIMRKLDEPLFWDADEKGYMSTMYLGTYGVDDQGNLTELVQPSGSRGLRSRSAGQGIYREVLEEARTVSGIQALLN